MFGGCAFMWPLKLRDVQAVFVDVHDQRDLGDVPFVQAISR